MIDEFFLEEPSKLENAVRSLFNDCLMTLQVYHENAQVYGFSLISNGQRVRTKLIENYEGSLIDYGPKLEEEKKDLDL